MRRTELEDTLACERLRPLLYQLTKENNKRRKDIKKGERVVYATNP